MSNRPSPTESATIFREYTMKKGNDKNIWINIPDKNNIKKWVQVCGVDKGKIESINLKVFGVLSKKYKKMQKVI